MWCLKLTKGIVHKLIFPIKFKNFLIVDTINGQSLQTIPQIQWRINMKEILEVVPKNLMLKIPINVINGRPQCFTKKLLKIWSFFLQMDVT